MPRKRGGGSDFLDALPVEGERRLMLAVLIDAIRGLTRDPPLAANLSHARRRDRAWLASTDHTQPFSFLSICDALGLNPDYIRRLVLAPPSETQAFRLRRYAASVEETWLRQRRKLSHTTAQEGARRASAGTR